MSKINSILIWFYTLMIPALHHGRGEEGPEVSRDLCGARPQCRGLACYLCTSLLCCVAALILTAVGKQLEMTGAERES